jgi:serine phosphatase RsbU (regulator of sigma subunit)
MKTLIAQFKKSILPGYDLLIKNIIFIMAGYLLATAETLAARIMGITPIDYIDILFLSSAALAYAVASWALVYFTGKVTTLIDHLVFYGNLALYLTLYSVWAFKLEELRILALFNALIAPTIVVTYTSLARSVMMFLGAAACQVAVSYYAIIRAGQPGDFTRELFFTIAFVPAFAFVSYFANRLQMQKINMQSSNTRLESANRELIRANEALEAGHRIAQIETKLAVTIQSGLFPEEPPRTDLWDVAFAFQPRFDLSGDFYDFYFRGDELRGMALFDVAGHGVSSALITMLAKPVFFRYFKDLDAEPLHRVIEAANLRLMEEIKNTYSFITGIMLRFDGDFVEYVNAGHPDLLHHRSGRETRILGQNIPNHKGRPLGIDGPTSTCKTMRFPVSAGDTLLLYTDCITESTNADLEAYGRERLVRSLDGAPEGSAGEVLEHVLGSFNKYLAGGIPEDDLTVIIAKRL